MTNLLLGVLLLVQFCRLVLDLGEKLSRQRRYDEIGQLMRRRATDRRPPESIIVEGEGP